MLLGHHGGVSGYHNMMYSNFKSHLTEHDVQDLIAYLLTLQIDIVNNVEISGA